MSWPLRLIENPELDADGFVAVSKRAVGDLWYHDIPPGEMRSRYVSEFYFNGRAVPTGITSENVSGLEMYGPNTWRRPLIVLLPGRNSFLLDGCCFSGDCSRCNQPREACRCPGEYTSKGYYGGWAVKGTPPNITVHPSINMNGRYHGFIKDGVITDDCEGRKFT